MTTIRVHRTHNKTFVVEGIEKREEPIPAFALPGHIDTISGGEQTMQVVVPALRFAPTVSKMVELVRYRVGEGDLNPVIYGPGCQPARSYDGSENVPPCDATARLARIDGGYMVTTQRAMTASGVNLDTMESANGRDMVRVMSKLLPMAAAGAGIPVGAFQVEAHAVATIDEALDVIRGFFGA